ncbi:S8 family peptidase [Kineothrix sedimenti]|uniref:S8 family peptidase n=1 Tax=Kineothrix sedimenti TaxID=3123317 RepID=A0ABZ3ET39_9FIRM
MACREQMLSNDYMEILLDYTSPYIDEIYPEHCIELIDDEFAVVLVNRSLLPPISISTFTYTAIPKLYGLMQENATPEQSNFDPLSLIRTGILQVQRPPLSLTGRGVIIGFIDTGIQYDLQVFRREDGTSRILAIWDQTIQDGIPPEGFSYGTLYTNEQINEALQSDDPLSIVPTTDTIGHGSAVASVAAGSSINFGLTFLGAAPDADIVVVKCREAKQYLRDYYFIPEGVPAYSGTDIAMAVKYLDSFGIAGIRPVVMCIGMGSNMGDHAGNSLLPRYLSRIAEKRSRVVVVCGGNEGNAEHHYGSSITMSSRLVTEVVEVRVDAQETGFVMELWGSPPNLFSVAIRSPGGEVIPAIDFRSRTTRSFSFIYERTKVTVDHILVEQVAGEEVVVFRFEDPTPGVWTFNIVIEGDSDYSDINMWLPITQFLNGNTQFLRSTPYTTLTEPSLGNNVITPSTYDDSNDSFYINSGRGFARGREAKPDFAAPGVNVSTVFGDRTGSSMSAAITAGASAQFMQWAVVEGNEPLVQSPQLKTYFMRGARRDMEVLYPSRSWGYGQLDIERTFRIIAGTVGG